MEYRICRAKQGGVINLDQSFGGGSGRNSVVRMSGVFR